MHIKRVEVLDDSGLPLFIYDIEQRKVVLDELLSDRKILRSSLIIAALQGLKETGGGLQFVETEAEKYIIIMKRGIVICILLSPTADPRSEKIQLFSHALAEGIARMHEKLGIEPGMVNVTDYIKRITPIFEQYLERLLKRIGRI